MSITQLPSCVEQPGSNVLHCTRPLSLCSALALFEAGTLGAEAFGVKEASFTVDKSDTHSGDMPGSKGNEREESPRKEVGQGVTEGRRLTSFVQLSSVSVSSSLSLLRFPLSIALLSRTASKARSPLDFPLSS
eukprot:1151031-Pelagomonas_calceolata.AAC.6